MNSIEIKLDKAINLYTILIDGEVKYECLSNDEVVEVISELMGGN